MRFISVFTILVRKEYLAKINNLLKHHGAGPPRRGAQCSRIGCIGLRSALNVRHWFSSEIIFGSVSHLGWTELTESDSVLITQGSSNVLRWISIWPLVKRYVDYYVDILKARWLRPVFAESCRLYVWIRRKNYWLFVFECICSKHEVVLLQTRTMCRASSTILQ